MNRLFWRGSEAKRHKCAMEDKACGDSFLNRRIPGGKKPMNLIKCPRCDLNYIREDEKYCKVCLREMKGEKQLEEMELCSICNEEP